MNFDIIDLSLAFEQLERYQRSIESFLAIEKQKHEESFDEDEVNELAKTAGEFEDQYFQHMLQGFTDTQTELSELFPHYFRASFLIQVFSFLEYELKKICDYYQRKHDVQFRMNDLKGSSDIDKAKLFLNRSAAISLGQFEPEWPFIDKVRTFRNILVHHQGRVKKSDKKTFDKVDTFRKKYGVIKYLEDEKVLDLDEDGKWIQIDRDEFTVVITDGSLNQELLSKTKSFLSKLIESLKS